MNTNNDKSIIEQVRAWKEENASEYGFDVDKIISATQEREQSNKERILVPSQNIIQVIDNSVK